MRIYQMTDVGNGLASMPESNPSASRRILYYLRKRNNWAASDDMIVEAVFGGDRAQAQVAMSKLLRARAVRSIGGG